ncbi:MAG: hypothetical protein CMM23_11275 [Rhodospirillaceae bacterium]|jgi:hypothetical protein|nr:hypothetical protein [Rhodospirillaceae bacterium]|tara:strand:+ start:1958 stop:2293 length:336 start_codon:yes stop_codon:yes gene_type:complete
MPKVIKIGRYFATRSAPGAKNPARSTKPLLKTAASRITSGGKDRGRQGKQYPYIEGANARLNYHQDTDKAKGHRPQRGQPTLSPSSHSDTAVSSTGLTKTTAEAGNIRRPR